MKPISKAVRTVATGFLLIAGLSAPSAGQVGVPIGDPVLVDPGDVRPPPVANPTLRCCRCVGEASQINLSTGLAVWTVQSPSAPPSGPANPTLSPLRSLLLTPPVMADPAGNPAWTSLPGAQWIGPPLSATTVGTYVYDTTFTVEARCVIPSTVTLSGSFAADNSAAVYIDSNLTPIATSGGTPNFGFLPGSITTFGPITLSPGLHHLKVRVYNQSGATGLIMNAMLVRKCSARTTTGPDIPPPPINWTPAKPIN